MPLNSLLLNRQSYYERGSGRVAFRMDRPAVPFDYAFGDGQAKSGPPCMLIAGPVYPVESFEYMRQIDSWNRRSIVDHFNNGFLSLFADDGIQLPAFLPILHCIG